MRILTRLRQLRERPALRPLIERLNNQNGMALLLAISTVSLIIFLAVEVSYDSSVEFNVNSQELNRMKAYYAARGATELGLLRIKLYESVRAKLNGAGMQNSPYAPYIEKLWNFPLQWPLPLGAVASIDKDDVKDKMAESLLDAEYTLDIADEGSKIDINDLGSPSKSLKENAQKILKSLFDEKLKDDDSFRKAYGTFRFDDLITNIGDFMSDKFQGASSGDKRAGYSEFQSTEIPPNRGFRTIGELRMVPLMDDRLYDFLLPRITIYGLKAVNPNTATLPVLRSLDPGIDEKVAKEIDEERTKKPFTDAEAFYNFVRSKAQKLVARSAKELPLTTDTMTSFRITATGRFAGTTRTINAVVMNIAGTAARVKTFVDKDKKDAAGATPEPDPTAAPGSPPKPGAAPTKTTETVSKGPPRIVYWYEQ